MKKKLLLCLCLAFTLLGTAQTQDKKWNIGFHGGASQFNGDYGNDFYETKMPFYGIGGLSISRYLGKHFDFNFLATNGKIGYNSAAGRYSTDMSTAALNLRFNILGPQSPVRPYVFGGAGAAFFKKNATENEKMTDFMAPVYGGGINFKLGQTVMFNLQETFMNSNSDKRDGMVAGSNDSYLFHTVGLSFNLGKKKDMDNDGVTDRLDKCPGTPVGVAVDKAGCALDRDKDGVADYLDTCPDIAGNETLKGCPDKDGDGITDADDRCPDAAGSFEMKGCPDNDKDGVANIDDKCPDTKAGYKVDAAGCVMDNDNDGIVNEEDRCPEAAGPVSLKGCPDSDGDGVADINDRCPDIKGAIINKGCPEITKEDEKKITEIASKLFFETNSAKLKVASLVQLDELAIILKRYETANLLIGGHTDSKGTDLYNLTLSQKRTESVKVYLTGKGIMESRLTATGFGEAQPIADNLTTLGRAKNRRVELKTSYQE